VFTLFGVFASGRAEVSWTNPRALESYYKLGGASTRYISLKLKKLNFRSSFG